MAYELFEDDQLIEKLEDVAPGEEVLLGTTSSISALQHQSARNGKVHELPEAARSYDHDFVYKIF